MRMDAVFGPVEDRPNLKIALANPEGGLYLPEPVSVLNDFQCIGVG